MLINLTNCISGYFLIYFEISVCLRPHLVTLPAFALLPYHACFQLATGLSIYSSSFALTTCHLVNLLSQAPQHSSWFCYFPFGQLYGLCLLTTPSQTGFYSAHVYPALGSLPDFYTTIWPVWTQMLLCLLGNFMILSFTLICLHGESKRALNWYLKKTIQRVVSFLAGYVVLCS